ncbi:MAG: hypothetical protein HOV79_27205 [Hamadaea sp.]|nr:hypothetical protein [Hamadaea sp.]
MTRPSYRYEYPRKQAATIRPHPAETRVRPLIAAGLLILGLFLLLTSGVPELRYLTPFRFGLVLVCLLAGVAVLAVHLLARVLLKHATWADERREAADRQA